MWLASEDGNHGDHENRGKMDESVNDRNLGTETPITINHRRSSALLPPAACLASFPDA